jgi:hypothetical protein
MANIGSETVTRLEVVSERFEQAGSDLDYATALLAYEVLVRPPGSQVPLGRSVAEVHVIGDVKFFEALQGAVNGALADVGVLSGNHCHDLLGAAVAFRLDQGGNYTTQGDGGAPTGFPHRPDGALYSGLARYFRQRSTPSHRSHGLVGTTPQQRQELSRRVGRFRAAR